MMTPRHLCWKNGWQICSACQGRIHLQGCGSKREPYRDCCRKRHEMLHAEGYTHGLDDAALVMLNSYAKESR